MQDLTEVEILSTPMIMQVRSGYPFYPVKRKNTKTWNIMSVGRGLLKCTMN